MKHVRNKPAPASELKLYGISPYRRNAVQVGWKVSISRRGVHFHRSFRASAWGGLDGALRAALAMRDEIDRKHPIQSKREMCTTLRSTNTSGLPGVYRVSKRSGKYYWEARLSLADRCMSRSFSIDAYGEDDALRRAVAARKKMLQETEGMPAHHRRALRKHVRVASGTQIIRTPAKEPSPNPYAPVADEMRGVCFVEQRKSLASGGVWTARYWRARMEAQENVPKRLQRNFSVERYGDEEARRLAIAQRRAWEAQRDRGETVAMPRSIPSSAVPGVFRARGPYGDRWFARIKLPDGRLKGSSFSIRKHGEEGAYQLAVKARKQLERAHARRTAAVAMVERKAADKNEGRTRR